ISGRVPIIVINLSFFIYTTPHIQTNRFFYFLIDFAEIKILVLLSLYLVIISYCNSKGDKLSFGFNICIMSFS
ncbi:MAG: hypothetical protein RSD51_03770, partial [Malacoplasma sp.]